MRPEINSLYKHYKGNVYRVVCIARHSEDLSELVVYSDASVPEKIWARPLEMWSETVEVNGVSVERFKKIGEGDNI